MKDLCQILLHTKHNLRRIYANFKFHLKLILWKIGSVKCQIVFTFEILQFDCLWMLHSITKKVLWLFYPIPILNHAKYIIIPLSLLDNAPKLGALSKRDLTISGSEGSYIPVPSPLGKIRSMTKEKIDVLFLRSNLPYQYHISLNDLECLETVGSGN